MENNTSYYTHWFYLCLHNCTVGNINLWEAWSPNLVCCYMLVAIATNLSCSGGHIPMVRDSIFSVFTRLSEATRIVQRTLPPPTFTSVKISLFRANTFRHTSSRSFHLKCHSSCHLSHKWVYSVHFKKKLSWGQMCTNKKQSLSSCVSSVCLFERWVCTHGGGRRAHNTPHSFPPPLSLSSANHIQDISSGLLLDCAGIQRSCCHTNMKETRRRRSEAELSSLKPHGDTVWHRSQHTCALFLVALNFICELSSVVVRL